MEVRANARRAGTYLGLSKNGPMSGSISGSSWFLVQTLHGLYIPCLDLIESKELIPFPGLGMGKT